MLSDFNSFLSSDAFLSFILILFLSMLTIHVFPISLSLSTSTLRKRNLSYSFRTIWNELVPFASPSYSDSPRTQLERAIYAFHHYQDMALMEVSQMQKTYSKISREHKRMGFELGYPAKLERLGEVIRENSKVTRAIAQFAEDKSDVDQDSDSESVNPGISRTSSSPGELRDVREALLHFVRDWSSEGKGEREVVMKPILDVLGELEPDRKKRKDKRVLVPGCGLGRLAWEVSQLGFTTHANELSPYMITSLRFLFSTSNTQRINQHTVHPYAHWFSHQRCNANLFRSVTFPDVLPRLRLSHTPTSGSFRLISGDFLHLKPLKTELYDYIVTQFFIDTSYNIITTLQQIHALLKPRGMWINLGPLLWRSGAQAALELSLDEVMELVKKVGFEIEIKEGDEAEREGRWRRVIECEYTADREAMMRWVYKAEFWVARKL